MLDEWITEGELVTAAARARLVADCPGPQCPEDIMGLRWRPGTRVLDTITGLEGVIIASARQHYVFPPARPGAGGGDFGAPK